MNSRDIQVSTDKPAPADSRIAQERLRRTFDAESLFGGSREIAIHFGQSVYHLRITRQGKLILNK